MKRILALALACLFAMCTRQPVFAQDAKPAETPKAVSADKQPAAEVKLGEETEKLKIQLQLVLQENASMRKNLAQLQQQLATTQQQLGQCNAQLAQIGAQSAEGNEQAVNTGGNQLLKQLADSHGLKSEEYDFKIDTKTGEMMFVRKTQPEAKK